MLNKKITVLNIIYISIFSSVIILISLIFNDLRLLIIGEPFGDHLSVLSVSLSHLDSRLPSNTGFDSILQDLRRIQNINSVNEWNFEGFQNHIKKTNAHLRNAINSNNYRNEKIHYTSATNGYILFVWLGLKLFGIRIQSFMYLWTLFLIISIGLYMVSHIKNIFNLL
jgi:hypothetical protein